MGGQCSPCTPSSNDYRESNIERKPVRSDSRASANSGMNYPYSQTTPMINQFGGPNSMQQQRSSGAYSQPASYRTIPNMPSAPMIIQPQTSQPMIRPGSTRSTGGPIPLQPQQQSNSYFGPAYGVQPYPGPQMTQPFQISPQMSQPTIFGAGQSSGNSSRQYEADVPMAHQQNHEDTDSSKEDLTESGENVAELNKRISAANLAKLHGVDGLKSTHEFFDAEDEENADEALGNDPTASGPSGGTTGAPDAAEASDASDGSEDASEAQSPDTAGMQAEDAPDNETDADPKAHDEHKNHKQHKHHTHKKKKKKKKKKKNPDDSSGSDEEEEEEVKPMYMSMQSVQQAANLLQGLKIQEAQKTYGAQQMFGPRGAPYGAMGAYNAGFRQQQQQMQQMQQQQQQNMLAQQQQQQQMMQQQMRSGPVPTIQEQPPLQMQGSAGQGSVPIDA